jgi:hypothetical protein
MKVTGLFFAWSAAIFYLIATIYHFVAHEVVGVTAIALTGGLCTIIAVYFLFTDKRIGAQPEDNINAEVHDADAEYGFFSPHSWWPLPVGFFAGVIAFGMVFAAWLVLLGVVGLLMSVGGWLFEYYRGDHLTW